MKSNYIKFKLKQGNFLTKVKFDIPESKVIALTGLSGSGKSTIAKAICGLIKPDDGTINLNNKVLYCSKNSINLPPHLRNIGMVFQEPRLFPHMSVKNNLIYGNSRMKELDSKSYNEIISILGIKNLLDRTTTNLSGGEAQRVSIGRALLSNPSILILDEPLTGLDAPRQLKILSIIKKINTKIKIPILFISHSLDEIIFMADKIIILNNGKITAQGTTEEIISNKNFNYFKTGNLKSSLLQGKIISHDKNTSNSILQIDNTDFVTNNIPDKIKSNHILRVFSNDVSLAKIIPKEISINNIIKCKIKNIKIMQKQGKVEVTLKIVKQEFLSEITVKSFKRLKLKRNQTVYALIKTVSIVGK